MNVSWYYAVKGTRTGPVSWEELRASVQSNKIGADDFVWSSSFGNEWRKASSLTGLFPAPEPEKAESKTPPLEEASVKFGFALHIEEAKSPFTPPKASDDGAVQAPEKVRCLQSLGRAWHNTKTILFSHFSFRRWFIFSICLMLTMLTPPNPIAGFSTVNDNPSANHRIEKLGLGDVVSSGLFTLQAKLKEASLPEAPAVSEKEIMRIVGEALRDTAVAVHKWINSGNHRVNSLAAALLILCMYALSLWFSARGHVLFLSRIYRPDDIMFATWMETDKPAATLFRGMLCIRILTTAAFFALSSWHIQALSFLAADAPVPIEMTSRILYTLFAVPILDLLIMGYIRDFVTPHIVLEDKTFLESFALAFRLLGFWFLRYMLITFAVYTVLFFILGMTGAAFGLGGYLAVSVVFMSPVFGSLLTLPLHLLRRLWSLDIIFRMKPELRNAVPKPKIIRILK